MAERVAIILAAGVSSRMMTKLPKVLHEVCGRAMLGYVFDACREANIERIYAVVGYGKEQIIERFGDASDVTWVEQAEQKGTGHAVLCCKEHLQDFAGQTLILCGDGPLIKSETLKTLIEKHESGNSAATLATAIIEEPAGYGRIVRDADDNIQEIVEDRDCSEKQLAINEVNPSYYCFNNKVLFEALEKITPDNAKNEYYLTDAVRLIIAAGHTVSAIIAVDAEDAVGVNDRSQLSKIGKIMQARIQDKFMNSGVTIVDPPNTWIDASVHIGQDTVIEPFTCVRGNVTIGKNCRIGPFAYLHDGAVVGDNEILGVFTETQNATKT